MTRILISLFLILSLITVFTFPSTAQSAPSTTEEQLSIEEQINNLLADLSSLQTTLRKQKQKRPVAKKIKSITRKITVAINSVPPQKCLETLKKAMDDFYKLVIELNAGISCGPVLPPPSFPDDDIVSLTTPITIDCGPPPDSRLQIGGPFGGSFADVYPVYIKARDLFQIDTDNSKISDVCE